MSEIVSGVLNETRQFVCGRNNRFEVRDASAATIKMLYRFGEEVLGSKYFYAKSKLESISEMTDSSGSIKAQYVYDPYGRLTRLQNFLESEVGYAGYHRHLRSGLYITATRLLNPNIGRWIRRDILEELPNSNLFQYVQNNPTNSRDPLGLFAMATGFGGSSAYGGANSTASSYNKIKCVCEEKCNSANQMVGLSIAEYNSCLDQCWRDETGAPMPNESPPTLPPGAPPPVDSPSNPNPPGGES